MARPYTLKRRAEAQAETRRRIVEAAVALHGSVGPARTSVSMVAERAGVQRHTFYAHFPDDRSLLMACSGLAFERDPPPDAAAFAAIHDKEERLRSGLAAIYGWYARNAQLFACVLRDAEHHPLTQEISALRFGPVFASYEEVLGAGRNEGQHIMLRLALSFFTWRTLARDNGLPPEAAAERMAGAVAG
jgi:AcrR family transcriptional regulator